MADAALLSGETRYTGHSVRRREDPRLITGHGRYVGDLRLPGLCDLAFVRSPHAHARIRSLDLAAASAVPGVLAVLRAADLPAAVRRMVIPPLAPESVHFVGQPVAAVAAEDRYAAEDGADAVAVQYDPLPAVVDLEAALAADAPRARGDLQSNLQHRFEARYGDWDAAVAAADLVVKEDIVIHRASGHPLEGRGLVVAPDPATGGLTVWAAVQSAHGLRLGLAAALGLPEHQVRVITPDVGGGFGVKNGAYPEDVVACTLALRLNRPVRWLEDRREHFLGCIHEREQVQHLEAAARSDGTVLGIRARLVTDVGPFPFRGNFIGNTSLNTLPGPYHVPNYDGACDVVYTNKVPTGPYRGAGRPQGNFAMERLLDAVARATGLDRVQVRRRNLIRADEMPFRRALPMPRVYDTGDYAASLDAALKQAGAADFESRRAAARQEGRYLGLGISVYNEDTGGGPFESARVRMEPSGKVVLTTGSPAQGQGHETTWAQLMADALGIAIEDVTVLPGDTAAVPMGVGTFGSRSAAVAGGAVTTAGRQLADRIRRLAAGRLEATPEDLVLRDGRVEVRGAPGRGLAMAEVARMAHSPGALPAGVQPGLEETVYFRPERQTFANGAHVVEAEVDPATGGVKILRYVVAHDCGRLLNPMLVEGQIHGGVMYGLSTALLEEIVYDPSGQILTATFMDYLLPAATDVPTMELSHTETPTPLNPNGAKGAGEGGTIPALAAVASAVEDALRPLGEPVVRELPLTPPRVYALAHRGGAAGA